MKISNVEENTGLSASTIRYYEDMDLITPERDNNNYRNYSDADVEALLEIKLLRKVGFPLKTIEQVIKKQITLQEGIDVAIESLTLQKRDIDNSLYLLEILKQSEPESKTVDTKVYVGKKFDFRIKNHPFIDFCDSISDWFAVHTFTVRKAFYPEEIITTPRDFTLELIRYAQREEKIIEILTESMQPTVIINNQRYQAIRNFEGYAIPVVFFKPKKD